MTPPTDLPTVLDDLYRKESRRILATLIRLLGDFDLAEDALHDAFRAALERWPKDGIPGNPRAWLVSTGRFKAIDRIRRAARADTPLDAVENVAAASDDPAAEDERSIQDDQLRLIFTCCHSALSAEARSALTLREVCGLTTEEIAAAFLTTPATLAQRIVRAKNKIRDAKIPYEVPGKEELPARLQTVLQVIYLLFNEGYAATTGDRLTRTDLSQEALRLGRLLLELLPEPEVKGLLALLLLHESRRPARTSAEGDVVLLEDQDRSRWDRGLIKEGTRLVEEALGSQRFGPYAVQAAIAAVHAGAPTAADTDWTEIVALYDVLLRMDPSPVVRLNRAVAVAMRDGPAAGLALIEELETEGELGGYRWLYSTQADLYRRLGKTEEARAAYEKALSMSEQEPERRFLRRRLADLAPLSSRGARPAGDEAIP